jgi:hypothetical protein
MARITQLIAADYDESTVSALYDVLADLRAFRLWRFAGMGGSQEIDFRWYRGGLRNLDR